MVKVSIDKESIKSLNISDQEYFSSKYKKYCSNSRLSLINPSQEGNPKKYFDNDKSGYSSSFEFGSAVHAMVLQPEFFVFSNYIGKPTAKLGVFVDKFIQARKQGFIVPNKKELSGLPIFEAIKQASKDSDYYVNKVSPKIIRTAIEKGLEYYLGVTKYGLYEDDLGREVIILPKKTLQGAKEAIKKIESSKKAQALLKPDDFLGEIEVFNEQAIFADIHVILDKDEVIIPFKLKIDNWTINHATKVITLNDLKTTGKKVDYFMGGSYVNENKEKIVYEGSFQKYHYYRQFGLYLLILKEYCKKVYNIDDSWTFTSNVIVVESFPDYNVKIFKVSQANIIKGIREAKELLTRVAFYTINDGTKEFSV